MLYMLRHAKVFAPEPLGVRDVLVAGGRIAAIGHHLPAVPTELLTEELDLEGGMLIPGLLDIHTHLTGGGGEGGAHTRVPSPLLSDFTRAGVTTAVGLLGTDGSTRTIAELLACARGLETLGLTTYCYTGAYEVPPPTLTSSVRGDIVHVDRIIAVGEVAISDHRSSQPTFDELVRIAADAHVAGMMTGKAGLLHLHMGDGRRGLSLVRRALEETEIPARVFHPTHVNRNFALWEEAKTLTASGCSIDVTAFPPDEHGPPAATALAEYLAAGLDPSKLTLSSDGGGCLPTFDAHGTLEHMDVGKSFALLEAIRDARELGAPLPQLLATCTSNAADLFRLHDKGRIQVGKHADLVVIDDRMQALHTMARGRWMVRDGKALVRGLFETEAGTRP
jgi:beta-aspartyl-dipeptidase (metallo-type)